jgi:D-alanyl-D-alanine carboxypeptidase
MSMARTGLALVAVAALAAACSKSRSPAPAPAPPPQPSDAARPASAGPADVAALLEPYRARGGMPALAAAAFRGDQLVAIGATGVREQGDPTAVTIDDQWHLGSDTKAMTATLIGLHVDRGTLHFGDTIATLFPGETIDPGYAGVTLEQLLHHRGGAPGTMPVDIRLQMVGDGAAPDARIKAVRALLARPPAQTPGTYVYANAGYMIAGAALERATGKTWEQLMTHDLFAPLGMTSCGFGAPGAAGRVDQPWGHYGSDAAALVPVEPGPDGDNPPALGPAGTVHCSLRDWGKLLAIHLAGARGRDTLVKAKTIQRLQTPLPGGDYAAGWIVSPQWWAGGTALNHVGSNTMWLAAVWLAPRKDVAYVVATNCASTQANAALGQAMDRLIVAYPP